MISTTTMKMTMMMMMMNKAMDRLNKIPINKINRIHRMLIRKTKMNIRGIQIIIIHRIHFFLNRQHHVHRYPIDIFYILLQLQQPQYQQQRIHQHIRQMNIDRIKTTNEKARSQYRSVRHSNCCVHIILIHVFRSLFFFPCNIAILISFSSVCLFFFLFLLDNKEMIIDFKRNKKDKTRIFIHPLNEQSYVDK